ncbi:MAG: NTP transferase domain-containing protein [Gemmatimonadetes bacterium]|nr:NTP transferase domain-containing protein [Gemmatimonadota bacterium]
MKAIIPLAGKGTRLRPHTHTTPKPLIRVAGRPVMSYILDDLAELGVDEIVFVVGYLREVIESYVADVYPNITAHYVVQEVQDGTAGAVSLAEPFVDEDVLILFVDTLFDADLGLVRGVAETTGGIIWAKEVEDYQRYGVILTDDEGHMVRIVEKPSEPISKLANIGLYYIKDWQLLFEGIHHTLDSPPGPSGEFYLTDAFQYMVDHGSKIQVAPVAGWYDCGKPETLLETNRHLLLEGRSGIADSATLEDSTVNDPVRVEEGAVVRNSVLGPNVTVEAGARVENSTVADTILGSGSTVIDSTLQGSLVGSESRVTAYRGRLSIGDHSEVDGEE